MDIRNNFLSTIITLLGLVIDNISSSLETRLEGLAHKVLQWYLCRMEGWFAADSDTISLKAWDQVILINQVENFVCISGLVPNPPPFYPPQFTH